MRTIINRIAAQYRTLGRYSVQTLSLLPYGTNENISLNYILLLRCFYKVRKSCVRNYSTLPTFRKCHLILVQLCLLITRGRTTGFGYLIGFAATSRAVLLPSTLQNDFWLNVSCTTIATFIASRCVGTERHALWHVHHVVWCYRLIWCQ